MNRAVFLDLNGTLVLPIQVERLSDLTRIPGVDEAVARLTQAGFVCPVVTVQSRITKGMFSLSDFRGWFDQFAQGMSAHGAKLEGPYVCPHRFNECCPCEKPKTLLYEQAAVEHHLDLGKSFVIGDSASDVWAAHRFGGQGCLVRTGWAASQAEVERATPYAVYIADSFSTAVDWILS